MTVDHLHGRSPAATRRLAARADSVAGVDAALGRMWAELARQGVTDRAVDGAMTTLARTRVLTLVVVASRPETAERAGDAVLKLAGRHPSRTLVLAFGDLDGPERVDARVQAHCHPLGGSSEVCTEQIFLRISGEVCQHPDAVAAPLLLHDLPVALWWTDDPPIGTRPFGDLMALADRLVVDSGLFRDDGSARLVALAAAASEGLEIHDIGWMRLEQWRTLLAGLFDEPALRPFLGGVRRIRVTVARPGSIVRIGRAALYLAWLASRLRWRVEEAFRPNGEDTFKGLMSHRGRRIEVEIVGEAVPLDGRLPAPGGFLRVEMESVRGRQRASATVARADDHVLAEADVDGRPCARRMGMAERHEDASYLAGALEAAGRDAIFHAALPMAVRLLARADSPA